MPGIKELKTRIKSISGTRKVTRAMQMVSAAKMRKSQDATMRSRTYASLAWELILDIEAGSNAATATPSEDADDVLRESGNLDPGSQMHSAGMTQLMQTYPKATKIAVLILSTNRGMVGSLNTNLINLVQKNISQSGVDADIITYGRKGRDVMVRSHKEVLADFEKFDRTISTEDIFPIAELITKLYSSGKYQKVLIFYNHFVSTLVQKPMVKQLLPFAGTTPAAVASTPPKQGGESPQLSVSTAKPRSISSFSKEEYRPQGGEVVTTDYLFEPNPTEVLKHLLPRIIESQIYQTILESEASEQSARMVMMKNATEAAGDLISDLTLTYNKLRQNKITTELAEITAGKIALE
jgi:F-type H+-transporting ATPase subunit gamma